MSLQDKKRRREDEDEISDHQICSMIDDKLQKWSSMVSIEFRDAAEAIESLDWTWAKTFSLKSLVRYKIFLLCKSSFNDLEPRKLRKNDSELTYLLTPTPELDTSWRDHLIRPCNYCTMCTTLLTSADTKIIGYPGNPPSAYSSDDYERTCRYMRLVSGESLEDIVMNGFKSVLPEKKTSEPIAPTAKNAPSSSVPPSVPPNKVPKTLADVGVLTLFLKTPTGKTINLHAMIDDTIGNLKKTIYEYEGFHVDKQCMIYDGKTLANEKSLVEQHVSDQSIIELVYSRTTI